MHKDESMIQVMEKYGGSFVVALANAMRHADSNNYTKLVAAFSNYVSEYRKMAKSEKKSWCCKAPMVNGGVQCENCGSAGVKV